MGHAKLPGIAAEDIGHSAYALFKQGPHSGTVGIAGDHLTGGEMASALSRALGRTVRYNEVEPAVFRQFPFPGADDLGNMFQFKRDFNAEFCGARDLAAARALHPAMLTFDQWLARNAGRIPLG